MDFEMILYKFNGNIEDIGYLFSTTLWIIMFYDKTRGYPNDGAIHVHHFWKMLFFVCAMYIDYWLWNPVNSWCWSLNIPDMWGQHHACWCPGS